ncbi:YfbM family protein [Flavobacterium sp. LS1R47]|uniref:YfbM family protein n=1 Tax=Flavobacterium frigoritolerans TaxID=2987686 RepID=A0A9X2Z0N9_9FLAO|nr:YfbM family protein [Flavobacterium frigoritolerans]MCV9932884.1 YfbM family protein [Flavobacterium frigoritolerans]
MSLTGSLYSTTDDKLKSLIKNDFDSIESLTEIADLSYFAINLLEILSKYSNLNNDLVGKILQGNNSFSPEDGFIGFSKSSEVKRNKIEILDKITSKNFIEYLKKGGIENNPNTPIKDRDFLIQYFENIKKAYEKAVSENMALIFRLG